MKKIRTTLLLMLLLPAVQVLALSDQEVLQIAFTMYQQGSSEQEIARELIQRGATLDQLQQLSKPSAVSLPETTSHASAGTPRTNNGEVNRSGSMQRGLLTLFGRPEQKSLVFGRDIFRSPEGQFEPNMNMATPKNYVLGPGDEIIIDIYGAGQLNTRKTISPDGVISIEGYGPIQLSGLTIMEATRRLKNTIGTRYQGSQIMLSLGQSRTIMVNVMGEVTTPGAYQLSAFANVMNALYMAGGITEKGTLRAIRIYRQNQQLSEVDLYSYMMDGVLDGDVRLEDGDVIIVGTYNAMTKIGGNVRRPMRYEMKNGETLERLLYFAGGFSGEAYTDAVRVQRRNDGARSIHTVRNEDFSTFRLMDGDSVSVSAILPRLKNTVSIRGAVFRPGYYGLDENVNSVRTLVAAADSLNEYASADRAVLYRMQLDRTYLALAINLKGIIEGSVEDIELLNEDQLFVPSKKNELDEMNVTIYGEVYEPDSYAFAHNESVEDLILRAGGLTENASTSKVDIARRVIDPKAKEETKIKTHIFTVELRDSLGLNDHGFLLEPYDEVYVRKSPAAGSHGKVRATGEVLFSGTYSLQSKDDRLSDLIHQAGGLNSHAFLAGARLQRTMTQGEQLRRAQLLKINRAADIKDSVALDKLDIGSTYWVGIDLEKALANPGGDEDVILRDGDVLIVPSINNTVKINGEVLYPNTVSFISGKRPRYYIKQAGGFSNNAKRCKSYIIYANGKVHPTLGGKVTEGCEIVVPSKPERAPLTVAQWVSIASASTSLASVAATITTLVITVTKNNK